MINRKFDDFIYQKTKILNIRRSVRGVVFNNTFEVAVLHIFCQDHFGARDHYELIGGGIEEGEDVLTTIARECLEESGATVENIKILGQVEQTYHLLNRVDVADIFYAFAKTIANDLKLEEYEKKYINEVKWINIWQLKKIFEESPVENVGKLIHRRELFIIEQVINDLNLIEN